MVSKTQIKNEERDTRKMIVAAKTAKKEAVQKSKKQQGKSIVAAAAVSGSDAKKRYKPKGAIILKSELSEAPSTTPSKDAKKGKDAKKNEGRNSTGKSTPVAELAGAVEPPFSYEVHHKSKRVLVDVTLHKVPGHLIDVSATTPTSLVVQTPKYTKKFSLVFPMPGNLKIDSKSAEYTFENGILKCVLPIAGDIPKELQAQREKLIESFKAQKTLRFRVTKEGDMVVRSRRTVLEKSTKKEEKKGAAPMSGEAKSAVEKKSDATKSAQDGSASSTPKAAKKSEASSPKQSVAVKKASDAPQQKQQPSKKKFVEDGAAMLNLAKESGNKLRNQLYAKLAQTKQIHQQRVERVSHRDDRKSEKKEKEKISFARVIAEQKRQLLEKTTMAAPAPKKPAAGKSVSFA